MARRKRSSGNSLSKHSIMELAAELHNRRDEVTDLEARRDELVAELEQIESILATMGGAKARRGTATARRGGRGARPIAGRRVASGKKRGKRGQGWAAIEGALKSSKGSGTSASLKDTWAKLSSKTPLSVALASFVKSGKLKRKGKGRETVFSLE